MSESLKGEVEWTDVDKETFVRLVQFAYTGEYSVGKDSMPAAGHNCLRFCFSPAQPMVTDIVCNPEDLEFSSAFGSGPTSKPYNAFGSEPTSEPYNAFGSGRKSKKIDKSKKGRSCKIPELPTAASRAFESLQYAHPPLISLCICANPIDDDSIENIGEVFLVHASLYVLAEKWGIGNLKMLSLNKLKQTLETLDLCTSKVQYIIDLAEYAYSNDNTPDLETGIDELRKLVCYYIAAYIKIIEKDRMFKEFFEAGGAFTWDIWKQVRQTSTSIDEEPRACY